MLKMVPKDNWSNIIFYAHAHNEPLQDVRVITARSVFLEQGTNDPVYEFVNVDESGITVCVNVDAISDENHTYVLQLVQETLEELNGELGTVEFGEPLTFTSLNTYPTKKLKSAWPAIFSPTAFHYLNT